MTRSVSVCCSVAGWSVPVPPSLRGMCHLRPLRTPHTAGHGWLHLQRRVIVLDSLALDLVHPARLVDDLTVGAGDAPRIATVRPIRRLQPMRLPKVEGRRLLSAARMKRLTKRKVRGGRGLLDGSRATPTDDLIGRERVQTLASVGDPVAKRDRKSTRLN